MWSTGVLTCVPVRDALVHASGGCNGDSGGPLVCNVGGTWYLHGAVSFGKQNCPTTHYTVFTRITSYHSWILGKIGSY